MFGKKKLLKEIQKLQERVTYLENMHVRRFDPYGWDCPLIYPFTGPEWKDSHGKICVFRDFQVESKHVPVHPMLEKLDYSRLTNIPSTTVDTDRISGVTLGELARLVIDGTPIKREEKISAKRISEYTEDTTTTITVTE